MKQFFFDLETTGVNHWQHGIHQISGMIVIDEEVKETFNLFVKPNPKARIEQEALKVGGIKEEDFATDKYIPMQEAYNVLVAMLGRYVDKFNKTDKFHLIGYNNASFDNNFLRAFFTQCGDTYFGSWFWSDSVDVMVLASNYLQNKRHLMPNFKLMTVVKELGIEVDETKLHDGLYDIELTKKAYDILLWH